MEEKKKCKYCQEEIDKKAKICPNCKKKQGSKVPIIVTVIIVLIIIIGLSGNNDSTNNSTSVNSNNVTVDSNASSDDNVEENKVEGKGKIANYEIEIKEHKITYDYGGQAILLVKLAFTNNNDEEKSFGYNLDCKAYQNGVELTTPISSYGIDGLDWNEKRKDIKSGVTYEFNCGFEIDDLKTPVQVEVVPIFSNKYSQKVTKTINL